MISAVRYADDKVVVSDSQQRLPRLMNNMNKVTTEINVRRYVYIMS